MEVEDKVERFELTHIVYKHGKYIIACSLAPLRHRHTRTESDPQTHGIPIDRYN